jgi:acyl dehydratase
MLDKSLEGSLLSPFWVEVDPGRLHAFAQATDQTNPKYLDFAVARAHGYPDLPIPPTFYFCLEMAAPQPMEIYERLGVDYAQVLHGEQHFHYYRMAFARERLHFAPCITSLYARKGGALEFIVRDTRVEAENGEHVADLRSVMVINHALAISSSESPSEPVKVAISSASSFNKDLKTQPSNSLPELVSSPITRDTLLRYAAASWDENPLHVDQSYARQAGHPDVFAHGMLSAAYLSRLLTDCLDQAAIDSIHLRFVAITRLGDAVHAQVSEIDSDSVSVISPPSKIVKLNAFNQHGECKVVGTARIRMDLSHSSHQPLSAAQH